MKSDFKNKLNLIIFIVLIGVIFSAASISVRYGFHDYEQAQKKEKTVN